MFPAIMVVDELLHVSPVDMVIIARMRCIERERESEARR